MFTGRLATTMLVCCFVLSLAATRSARALERIPIKAVLCYPAAQVESWSYEASGNTLNGVLDHEGYVRLNFNLYRAPSGARAQTSVSIPTAGLEWDLRFRRLLARGSGGELQAVCATRSRFWGVHRLERNCRLEGRVVPKGESAAWECGDKPAYLFDGALVVLP